MAASKKSRKTITTGQLINKLERAIAVANMRGDRETARKLMAALTVAVNSTLMPEVCA